MKHAALPSIAIAALFATQGCGNPASSSSTSNDEIAHQRAPIVNGIADLNHRYVVSLNGCSGTLISKQTIITAGHCYGSISTAGFGNKSSGATTIKIASKVRHPMYEMICDQDATYDLTVAKLETPATVQPAPLLRQTLANSPKYMGPSWVWVGFGLTMQGGTSGTKRVTTFPMELIGPAPGRGSLCDIPETLIYTSTYMGRNACNGDSGGPSFFVYGGVEYLGGVVSSGDDACMVDDTQQRSDQPYIDGFIQAQIDANEGTDPCRNNGVCDESCNTNGQVMDPDCQAAHCGADGLCAEACVAPRDPDCATVDSDNCGDNGVCDLKCTNDPDCIRDCAAEGNCIPNCATPDPDCAGQDGGTTVDAGGTDGGGGGTTDAGARDGGVADATTQDSPTPTPDAGSGGAGGRDAGAGGATTADSGGTRDATTRDTVPPSDSGTSTGGTAGATPDDSGTRSDAGTTAGAGGSSGSGAGGSSTGTGTTGTMGTPEESGCNCRVGAASTRLGGRAAWLGLALAASALRRRSRRRSA